MAYHLKVERQAFRQIERLAPPERKRVTEAILALEDDPFPPGNKCKSLVSAGGLARLRVGDYRVLYEVLGDDILVLAVILRRELDRWIRRS